MQTLARVNRTFRAKEDGLLANRRVKAIVPAEFPLDFSADRRQSFRQQEGGVRPLLTASGGYR